MIKIDRPAKPKIPIYVSKKYPLDRNSDKDKAIRKKLITLIDATNHKFHDIFQRLSNDGKFSKAEVETLKAIAFFADKTLFKNDKKQYKNR